MNLYQSIFSLYVSAINNVAFVNSGLVLYFSDLTDNRAQKKLGPRGDLLCIISNLVNSHSMWKLTVYEGYLCETIVPRSILTLADYLTTATNARVHV